MKIEIYSDVMCPWCYIGERRLQRALSEFSGEDVFEVVYRPFQLDPAAPREPVPMKEYLRKKFGAGLERAHQNVAAVGREEGIEFDFENGVIVNTLTAHRLLRLAERESGPEVQADLAERLFSAHFEQAADIADHAVLTELATSSGMDSTRVRAYLASDEGLAETQAELSHAIRRGVRAVPTFVFDGRFAVQGAQPVETFLEILEEITGDPTDYRRRSPKGS